MHCSPISPPPSPLPLRLLSKISLPNRLPFSAVTSDIKLPPDVCKGFGGEFISLIIPIHPPSVQFRFPNNSRRFPSRGKVTAANQRSRERTCFSLPFHLVFAQAKKASAKNKGFQRADLLSPANSLVFAQKYTFRTSLISRSFCSDADAISSSIPSLS